MGNRRVKLRLDTYGNYLGMEKGCLILRDINRNIRKLPYYETDIEEIALTSGNTVTTGTLEMRSLIGFRELLL